MVVIIIIKNNSFEIYCCFEFCQNLMFEVNLKECYLFTISKVPHNTIIYPILPSKATL